MIVQEFVVGMPDLKWGQISLQNWKHQARTVINTVHSALMWVVADSIIIFWNAVFII